MPIKDKETICRVYFPLNLGLILPRRKKTKKDMPATITSKPNMKKKFIGIDYTPLKLLKWLLFIIAW